MNHSRSSRVLLFGCVLAFPASALAVSAGLVTTIDRTLVDSDRYGGCMAHLTTLPSSVGLDCPSGWVTFSCSGDLSSKDIAYRKFDSAQLAFVQERRVFLRIDDAQTQNGHCFAARIDILP